MKSKKEDSNKNRATLREANKTGAVKTASDMQEQEEDEEGTGRDSQHRKNRMKLHLPTFKEKD